MIRGKQTRLFSVWDRNMISQELLDMLRCPLDSASRLEATAAGLVCQRCRLRFPLQQEIPCMVVEDAELPAGCARVKDLPCQQKTGVGGSQDNANSPAPHKG